jgi:hypothetical protein
MMTSMIKKEFRKHMGSSSAGAAMDTGLQAMRELSTQMAVHQCSSVQETDGVRIIVTSVYDTDKVSSIKVAVPPCSAG